MKHAPFSSTRYSSWLKKNSKIMYPWDGILRASFETWSQDTRTPSLDWVHHQKQYIKYDEKQYIKNQWYVIIKNIVWNLVSRYVHYIYVHNQKKEGEGGERIWVTCSQKLMHCWYSTQPAMNSKNITAKQWLPNLKRSKDISLNCSKE